MNWDVFALDLFLSKEDLCKHVVNKWKPMPPGQDVLAQWFGKFEVSVSCIVLGIEKLLDTIVDTYRRCAPKLSSRENLLMMMKMRVTMTQEVLSMKLTDLSSDPSTLDASDGLKMVPEVLAFLHRDELDLLTSGER